MKRLFILSLSLLISLGSIAFTATNIDEKLVRLFKASFPDATEVVWYEFPETFTVHFVEDGIRNRISYWKDGQLVEFIRYYQERALPPFIRYCVKKKYPDQTIFGVVEISTASDYSNVTYYIKMEDAKTWFTVKVDGNGACNMVEKFKKH